MFGGAQWCSQVLAYVHMFAGVCIGNNEFIGIIHTSVAVHFEALCICRWQCTACASACCVIVHIYKCSLVHANHCSHSCILPYAHVSAMHRVLGLY